MNAIEFMKRLKGEPISEDVKTMSAMEYFETDAGKKIFCIIAEKVRPLGEKSFELVDWSLSKILRKEPLYEGRDFFKDMEELGFTCRCTSYHQDEAPVRTYLFELK